MDRRGGPLNETAVSFGSSSPLVGILSEAASSGASGRPAVVLLDAGLIHRVAPGRLYVRLARELAQQGHDCLRFDFSGIGDSGVRDDALPVEESGIAETREAMDLLAGRLGHRRFILAGLCGGGYFSFRTALADRRVTGLVLLNVRGHLHGDDVELGEAIEAAAQRTHYRRIARSPRYRRKNILKVARGEFDLRGALRSLGRRRGAQGSGGARLDGRSDRLPSERPPAELVDLWERDVGMLNIYSEGDWSLDYVETALGGDATTKLSQPGSRFELLEGTNHVFTPCWSQDEVVRLVTAWLDSTAREGTDASS